MLYVICNTMIKYYLIAKPDLTSTLENNGKITSSKALLHCITDNKGAFVTIAENNVFVAQFRIYQMNLLLKI